MIDIKSVCDCLINNEVDFFTGVPDSYLNSFCTYIVENHPEKNVIAANEGNAVAIAAGHYIATQKIPLVYMQNSGLGNAINPLVSLVDENVYNIPMLLLIGWRGQPGTGDWPQHICQGKITPTLIDDMNIPYDILSSDIEKDLGMIRNAVSIAKKTRKPYALIVPKGIMTNNKENVIDSSYHMSRRRAIEVILNNMPSDSIYCASTGRITRELYYLRKERGESNQFDFLNVGAMGHTSSVAVGIALSKPQRQCVVLDGDAATIMHMGSLTKASELNLANCLHVILNNGVHESVGGQPSAGYKVNFTKIAEACGYATVGKEVTKEQELIDAIQILRKSNKMGFIDVWVHKGMEKKLPPLDFLHKEQLDTLMQELK